jgi:hypothetical protein
MRNSGSPNPRYMQISYSIPTYTHASVFLPSDSARRSGTDFHLLHKQSTDFKAYTATIRISWTKNVLSYSRHEFFGGLRSSGMGSCKGTHRPATRKPENLWEFCYTRFVYRCRSSRVIYTVHILRNVFYLHSGYPYTTCLTDQCRPIFEATYMRKHTDSFDQTQQSPRLILASLTLLLHKFKSSTPKLKFPDIKTYSPLANLALVEACVNLNLSTVFCCWDVSAVTTPLS